MGKKLFVNSLDRETRVAVLEDQKIVEYLIERSLEKRVVGNVYKGKVVNVLPGMQAAFVDIGIGKNAFLYVDDIYPSKGIEKDFSSDGEGPPIKELVKEGEELLVQVNKESVGNKGARITTNISLAGRYLVYVPYGRHIGISRKIEEETERERLKEIGESIVQGTEGLIIRTACEGISRSEFEHDVLSLRAKWKEIREKEKTTPATQLVYQDMDIISKLVRDLMTEDVDECIIDHHQHFQRISQEIQLYPEIQGTISHYTGNQNIFDYYEITADLERSLRRKVWLKSGGYLIIDQTEALTVIDVNTGKYTGTQNLEETVFKINKEAVVEIARQMRLRDIGGIIIVDFIDMTLQEHQQELLDLLTEAVKKDRTKINVVGLTALGLVEMTRKKIRKNVLEVTSKQCSYCDGKGYTLSEDSVAIQIERTLIEYRLNSDVEAVVVQVHPYVAGSLFGEGRRNLKELEKQCGFKIFIHGKKTLHIEEFDIVYMGAFTEAKRKLELLQNE